MLRSQSNQHLNFVFYLHYKMKAAYYSVQQAQETSQKEEDIDLYETTVNDNEENQSQMGIFMNVNEFSDLNPQFFDEYIKGLSLCHPDEKLRTQIQQYLHLKQNLNEMSSFQDGNYQDIIEDKKIELNQINEILYKKHTHLFSLKKQVHNFEQELSQFSLQIQEQEESQAVPHLSVQCLQMRKKCSQRHLKQQQQISQELKKKQSSTESSDEEQTNEGIMQAIEFLNLKKKQLNFLQQNANKWEYACLRKKITEQIEGLKAKEELLSMQVCKFERQEQKQHLTGQQLSSARFVSFGLGVWAFTLSLATTLMLIY